MSVLTVLLAAAFAFAVAHVALAWYFVRHEGVDALDGRVTCSDVDAHVDAAAGTVECPNCGAENGLGYRFCGNCVAELPGVASFDSATRSPGPRRYF